jgi:spermidine synthase
MGFTLLGLEVLLLLGFQALYGYVYQQLSILVAVFMVGMAAGAWLALRNAPGLSLRGAPPAREDGQSHKSRARLLSRDCGIGMTPPEYLKLALLQLLAALSPLLLYALFVLLEGVRSLAALLTISQIVFPVLALIAGLMGGYQFPLASRIYFARSDNSNRNPGVLYALDLVGACLGAVALSAYLLPVYGFLRTAMLMAVVNLAPAGLAGRAAFEVRFRRT